MNLQIRCLCLVLFTAVHWSSSCDSCSKCDTCIDSCAASCSQKCTTSNCTEDCHNTCTSTCRNDCNSCTSCTEKCDTCRDSCTSGCSDRCSTSSCRENCQDSCSSSCDHSCSSCRQNCKTKCCSNSSTCDNSCRRDCHQTCDNNPTIIPVPEISDRRENSRSDTTVNSDVNVSPITNISNVIQVNNTLINVNKIHIPINITTTNINNINLESTRSDIGTHTSSKEVIYRTRECENTTKGNCAQIPIPYPVVIRVPVMVPVTIPNRVPVPIPYPISQPSGCCVVVIPCANYGCSSYNRVCGNDCVHPYMFSPRNPCGYGGCQRMSSWNRQMCYSTGMCSQSSVDCNHCGNDYYQNYNSYMNCAGCFQNGMM